MGIPAFMREILFYYPESHFAKDMELDILCWDFNSIVYEAFHMIKKKISYEEFSKMSSSKKDRLIIEETIRTVKKVIHLFQPKETLYIALDGSVPKGKLLIQRSRRYKAVKLLHYLSPYEQGEEIYEKHWSTSNISPGTSFMNTLSKELKKCIEKKEFPVKEIILDDTQVPGEGEYKIFLYLNKIKHKKIGIVSPDADLIVLSFQLMIDSYIIRKVETTIPDIAKGKEELLKELKTRYEGKEYFFLSIKHMKKAFMQRNDLLHLEEQKFSYDLIFLTFFLGNDFIKKIPFLFTKDHHFEILSSIYQKVSLEFKDTFYPYLLHEGKIQTQFLSRIMEELATMEEEHMKQKYQRIQHPKIPPPREFESKYQQEKNNYEHLPYYFPHSPFYRPDLIHTINYFEKNWKEQYYTYFFFLTKQEISSFLPTIIEEYLKSLYHTFHYYTSTISCWNFAYDFRVAPFPSDILKYLPNQTFLSYSFPPSEPYTPLEQLFLILPPQRSHLLPYELKKLMYSSPLEPFFPIDFQIDLLEGEKFIYSEAILPPIVDEWMLPLIKKVIQGLHNKSKDTIKQTYEIFHL